MSRERGPDAPAEDPPAETPDPGRQEPPDEPPLLPGEPIEEPADSPIQDLPPRRDPDPGEPPQGDPPAGPPQQVRAGFARFVTRRPVAVLMLFLAAVVFGWFSYRRLPVTLMPELSYPTLTVRTEYPGAAPEEVENDISRPLEEALGVVSGLRRISSVSRAGVSDVVLEFAWDTDLSAATQDTLEKLDLVFLPEDAERPLILHYDPSLDPVLELSLSGQGDRFRGEEGLRRLRRLAELQVKRALEPIKGVAAVRVRGGLEEEIHVLLDDDALRRTGLSIQAVIDRLRQENINVAGGTIQEGRTEYMVRTLNEYPDLREIGETVVASLDGREVRVRDLGRVVRAHKERQMLTRTDGGESVQMDVFKEADANIVAVAERVRAALGDAEKEGKAETRAPPAEERAERGGRAEPVGLGTRLLREEGARLQIVADRSVFIRASIAELRDNCILGGLLAVLVLLVFLRELRATAIVAVNIPIALLLCFAPLHLLGVCSEHHVARRPGARRRHAGRLLDRRAGVDLPLPRGGGRPRRRGHPRHPRGGGGGDLLDPDHDRRLLPHGLRRGDRRPGLRRPRARGRGVAVRGAGGGPVPGPDAGQPPRRRPRRPGPRGRRPRPLRGRWRPGSRFRDDWAAVRLGGCRRGGGRCSSAPAPPRPPSSSSTCSCASCSAPSSSSSAACCSC